MYMMYMYTYIYVYMYMHITYERGISQNYRDEWQDIFACNCRVREHRKLKGLTLASDIHYMSPKTVVQCVAVY